jgi:hypothetical protein
VICEFPPTTNLLVLRGCHRSLLSDWNMAANDDIARNVPPATNTADKMIIWLYVDKQSKVVRHRRHQGTAPLCIHVYMHCIARVRLSHRAFENTGPNECHWIHNNTQVAYQEFMPVNIKFFSLHLWRVDFSHWQALTIIP